MAPIVPVQPSRNAYEALIELERSHEPFSEQIVEAAQIIKFDLNASLSSVPPDGLEKPVGREILFSGKEEWVLRWLLKKLEAQGNDARLDPQAWLLMKKLVEQIPVVNAARLLSAHNFLQTLEKTLEDGLAQAQDIRQGQAASPNNDLKGPSDISDASGSSSTLMGTSTPGSMKQSRKRKRPAASMEETMSTSPPSDNAHLIETLFCSLLGALSQLVEMSTKPSNGESVFAGQYMTAILRTDPNRTACIFRSAFNAAEFLMRNDQLSGSAMSLTVASAVASFVTIWEYRSVSADDLFGRASNEAFASHCLVPALVLLSSCCGYQHKYSVLARTVTMLEQLLARHIVLPSRSDFLAVREQGASKASLDSILPSDHTPLALLEPLRSIDSEPAPNNTPTAGSNLDMRVVSTIPLLFDVAVRCLPRDTQRKRIMEAPWLEAIFLNLTNQISLPIFSVSAVFVSQQSLEIFEQMLQTAIDRNVSLDTTILRSIVTRFSGILNIGKDSCRWTLIAKTLKLDANVFLIPTDVKPDPKGFSQPADKLLNTLFSQITTVGSTLLPTFSDDYKLIRSLIVLPLLREYAKARDLSGFLRHWHTELMAHEGSHSTSEDQLPDAATSRHLSIWEDVDLINELRSLLESSLTAGQIDKTLHLAMPDFEAFLDSGSGSHPGAYASLVVLDAILGAVQREETTDMVSGTVQSISQAITRLLSPSANWPKKHRWRLWHIATLINLQWPQAWSAHTQLHVEATSTSGFPNSMWALNAIGGIIPSESGLDIVSWSFERYFDVVQAFYFILSCAFAKTGDNSLPSWFSEAVENIIMTIVPLLQYALTEAQREGKDPKFHWDGRPESVTSWDTLIVALATGVLRFPQFLKYATADSRFDLLQKLYRLAHWQDSVSEGNAKTLYMRPLVSVWEGLLEYEAILNNPIVLEDFLGIQVGALRSESEPTTPSQGLDMFPDLAVRVLLNLPLAILRRHHREKILDSVLQRSSNLHTTSGFSALTAHTSLMARLMEVPNASSILATDPAAIWDLARAFDQNCPGPDEEGLYAFEELVKLTLKHLISTKDQDRSRDYLKTFHTRLFDSLAEVGSTPANYGTQRLVKAALSMFWLHRDSLSKPLKEKEVKRLRRMYFDRLISDLMNFGESRRSDVPKPSRTTLLATLDSMTGYEDLLQSDKRRPTIYSTFFDILTAMVPATDIADDTMPVESGTAYRVTSQVLTTIYTLVIYSQEKRGTSSMNLPLLLQLLRLTRFEDQQTLLLTFRDTLTTTSLESRLDLICELEGQGLETGVGSDQLRLLAVTISTIEDPGKHSSVPTRAVSNVFIGLSGRLWQSNDYRQFCLIAQCLGLIVRQKPWTMTQWGIDTALSAITSTVSPSGPQLPPQHAVAVYQHLCGFMGAILTVHRTKLGGRYHLIIPLLQGMLRCLFMPDVRSARSAKTMSLPPWVSRKGNKLGASSAAAYARLLITICEPTVSSVTSSKSRSRQELNDETRKVRATAGQYLPYLIMEYSQCQLNARISPEVKAALTPGLWAVFNVMSQQTMRTLNAAMDSSSRAIFKALYEDYRRFGKWDQI